MKKMIVCFGSLILSVAAMAANDGLLKTKLIASTSETKSDEALATICSRTNTMYLFCGFGNFVIVGYTFEAYWCDSGVGIAHLSHSARTDPGSACGEVYGIFQPL